MTSRNIYRISAPDATAQCHEYIRNNLAHSELHAAIYNLEVIASNIADHEGNQTRFVLVADVLRDLHAKQGVVKFLGSYPTAGAQVHSARKHADTRWREADDWVTALRARIAR